MLLAKVTNNDQSEVSSLHLLARLTLFRSVDLGWDSDLLDGLFFPDEDQCHPSQTNLRPREWILLFGSREKHGPVGPLEIVCADLCARSQSLLIEASRTEQIIATAEEPLFLE
jgi:hypothetical protein